MSGVRTQEPPRSDRDLRDLTRDVLNAPDPQIMRVVAIIDGMISRGSADALVSGLRSRLTGLRPPRPLRFPRLLFHPLDPLIVDAAAWHPGDGTIPRTALLPIAAHVRDAMGEQARGIDAEAAQFTTFDTDAINRLGQAVWPRAASIVGGGGVPATWDETGLSPSVYQDLAPNIAALLGQAAKLEQICVDTAHGLLPPNAEAVLGILKATAQETPAALRMLIALMLAKSPAAAQCLESMPLGPDAPAVRGATEKATERLLAHLDSEEGIHARVAAGTLADAGVAAAGILSSLKQIEARTTSRQRLEAVRSVRRRVDTACRKRFAHALQESLLAPLSSLTGAPADSTMKTIEATARGLRVLESEGRAAGSGGVYDMLLRKAAEVVQSREMRANLSPVDQLRLVEILSGPEAALAIIEQEPETFALPDP